MADASNAKFLREPNVVWRLGPDRVLVRRIGSEGLDLVGPAALVWIALDSPRTRSGLVDEISSALCAATDIADLEAALSVLVDRGLVRESP